MKTNEEISYEVDRWIVEEDLPASAALEVVRKTDANYGMTADEIRDRKEFIRCYMMQEHQALMVVPLQEPEYDFFIADCDVTDEEYSAFNKVDYQKTQRPFNKYAYAMKKMMEQVKSLAINHSSISCPEIRKFEYERYEAFVDREFRQPLLGFVRRFNDAIDLDQRQWLKKKIAELNRRIMECQKIWGQYSPLKAGTLESFSVGTPLVPWLGDMSVFIKLSFRDRFYLHEKRSRWLWLFQF